jgi:fructose/tagatose bisphosphate aldolase
MLTINDHGTETVRSFKYLVTAINITNNETTEIKARIMTANKANCPVHTTFRYKQIQRSYKIRLQKHQSGQYCVTKM